MRSLGCLPWLRCLPWPQGAHWELQVCPRALLCPQGLRWEFGVFTVVKVFSVAPKSSLGSSGVHHGQGLCQGVHYGLETLAMALLIALVQARAAHHGQGLPWCLCHGLGALTVATGFTMTPKSSAGAGGARWALDVLTMAKACFLAKVFTMAKAPRPVLQVLVSVVTPRSWLGI